MVGPRAVAERKIPCLCRKSNPGSPARILVAVLTDPPSSKICFVHTCNSEKLFSRTTTGFTDKINYLLRDDVSRLRNILTVMLICVTQARALIKISTRVYPKVSGLSHNEINNNKHALRSNIKGYGRKSH
jgi:hypothetical protein